MDGHGNSSPPRDAASDTPPRAGLLRRVRTAFARLLRRPGRLQGVAQPSPEPPLDGHAAPLHEVHCASREEAEELARRYVRDGYGAVIAHDPYDYSWSVEVHATPASGATAPPAPRR